MRRWLLALGLGLGVYPGAHGFAADPDPEIWDEAWQCPHCDAVVEGRILRDRPDPAGRLISKRAVLVLAGGLVLLLLLLQIR